MPEKKILKLGCRGLAFMFLCMIYAPTEQRTKKHASEIIADLPVAIGVFKFK